MLHQTSGGAQKFAKLAGMCHVAPTTDKLVKQTANSGVQTTWSHLDQLETFRVRREFQKMIRFLISDWPPLLLLDLIVMPTIFVFQ